MLTHMTAMAASLRQRFPFSSYTHSSLNASDLASYYSGHVAAVTGAGSGMGRELARHLASMGCNLALADINPERLAHTQELLAGCNIEITTTVLDVADKIAVDTWADNVMVQHGKVNFIFNNAGVAMYSTVEGSSVEELEWVMDINFWGVVYGTKAFLPLIKQSVEQSESNALFSKKGKPRQFNENGHIINISSLFGLIALPSQSAYNASKFAVRGFTESLRQELDIQQCGVHATCVHPGGIKTNIANNARGNDSLSTIGMHSGSKAVNNFNNLLRFDAKDAAWIILQAASNNQARCLIGNDAKMMDGVQRVFPTHYGKVVHNITRLTLKLNLSRRAKHRAL